MIRISSNCEGESLHVHAHSCEFLIHFLIHEDMIALTITHDDLDVLEACHLCGV